jgi:hypothetical protein
MPTRTGAEFGGVALLKRSNIGSAPNLLTGKDGLGAKPKIGGLSVASSPHLVSSSARALESAAAAFAWSSLRGRHSETLPMDKVRIAEVSPHTGVAAASVVPPTIEWGGNQFTHNGLREYHSKDNGSSTFRADRVISEPAVFSHLPHDEVMPDIVVGAPSGDHAIQSTTHLVPMPDLPRLHTSPLVEPPEELIIGDSGHFTSTDIRPSRLHVGAIREPSDVMDAPGFSFGTEELNGGTFHVAMDPVDHKRHVVTAVDGEQSELLIPKWIDTKKLGEREKPTTFSLDVIIKEANIHRNTMNAKYAMIRHISNITPAAAVDYVLRQSSNVPREENVDPAVAQQRQFGEVPPSINSEIFFRSMVTQSGLPEETLQEITDRVEYRIKTITDEKTEEIIKPGENPHRVYYESARDVVVQTMEQRTKQPAAIRQQAEKTTEEVRGYLGALLQQRRLTRLDRPTGTGDEHLVNTLHRGSSHTIDGLGPIAGVSGDTLSRIAHRIIAPDGSIRGDLEGEDAKLAEAFIASRENAREDNRARQQKLAADEKARIDRQQKLAAGEKARAADDAAKLIFAKLAVNPFTPRFNQ